MLKLIGAVMIMVAGTALGFIKADGLKKRGEYTGKIISGLSLLETEITYDKRDITKALSSIGKNQGIPIFQKTAEKIKEKGIKMALEEAVFVEAERLSKMGIESLKILGESLGMTDTKNQVSAIKRTILALENEKSSLEAEYAKFGKLYQSVGVLGGILVAIILI